MMDYKPPNNLMKSLALNVYSQMKDHKLTSPKKVGRCLERVIFFFSPSERPGAQGTRLKSLKGLKRLEEVVKLNARTLVRFDYAVIIAYGGYALKGGTHFIRSERYSQGRINLTSFGHLPEYLLK